MMSGLPKPPQAGAIIYPESDGKPMADCPRQARWMMFFHDNLEVLLRDAEAFVALNLLWYAQEGEPSVVTAPNVFVALGRPRGDRGSYKQWEEGGVAPQVVIEVQSPQFIPEELQQKDAFYDDHGVEEYYLYDLEKDYLEASVRKGSRLRLQWFRNEFVSPRLGIRFDLTGDEMRVFYPDGRPFLTFVELAAERAAAEQRFRRLAQLSRKARQGQATPEEVAELMRLESEAGPPAP
jgi:hypothetical protein